MPFVCRAYLTRRAVTPPPAMGGLCAWFGYQSEPHPFKFRFSEEVYPLPL